MITQQLLKHFLNYDPETGYFTWCVRTSNRINIGTIAGTVDTNGYLRIRVCGKVRAAHRLVWLYVHGYFPEGDIDHVDGNRLNNALNNLRECNRSQNLLNKPIQDNNVTGVKGVCWDKRKKLWEAYAKQKGVKIRLGMYKNFDDAVRARKEYIDNNYDMSFYREK